MSRLLYALLIEPASGWRRADWGCLLAVLVFGLWLLAPYLAHPLIWNWDESMHQAAARGVHDTLLYPHIYADHIYPWDPRHYWAAGPWLNKPPAPLWFAALAMKFTGVSPLALRLASLCAELAAAGALYWLLRGATGRLLAAFAGALFLALPFGWQLVQGLFFGDVTDCTLVGANTLAIALLVAGCQRKRWYFFAGAGAAIGFGFLCKSVLALTPLGVAGALWLLAFTRRVPGPSTRGLATLIGAAVLVALPWNLYAAHAWPEPYWMHARTWLGHLTTVGGLTADIGPWARPVDAIFNEINDTSLRPIPTIVSFVAGVWLLIRAITRRELAVMAMALWLWATWIVLSAGQIKVPACTWGATPAVMAGLVLLAQDVFRSASLAFVAMGAAATPWFIARVPRLADLHQWVPASLPQSKRVVGLTEGVALVLGALVLGLVAALLARRFPRVRWGFGTVAALGLAWIAAVNPLFAFFEQRAERIPELYISHTRELGLALDAALPARSVLFQALDSDPPNSFETHNLMFWSGRMTYRRDPDPASAKAKGYQPYLISPAAEPYEPVEGVPAQAWLRAYDLEKPRATPVPLPAGVLPLTAMVPGLKLVGLAWGPIDGRRDRWAIYAHSPEAPPPLRVVFETRAGKEEQTVRPEQSLRSPARLAGAPWFILPLVGPPRIEVLSIAFGDQPAMPLPPL